jgi:hypothetical protein
MKRRFRLTGRCLRDDLGRSDLSAATPAEELIELHDAIDKFIALRTQDPAGQEATTLANVVSWNLHAGRHRGLTYWDKEHEIVWLLGFGLHMSGHRDDAYAVLKRLDAAGQLEPTEEDIHLARKAHDADREFWPAHPKADVQAELACASRSGWNLTVFSSGAFGRLRCAHVEPCLVVVQRSGVTGAELRTSLARCPHSTKSDLDRLRVSVNLLADAIQSLAEAESLEDKALEAIDSGDDDQVDALDSEIVHLRRQAFAIGSEASSKYMNSRDELQAELTMQQQRLAELELDP